MRGARRLVCAAVAALLLTLAAGAVVAHAQQNEDWVDSAAKLLWAGKTHEAEVALDAWLAQHPDDLRALRLRALALAWSGHVKAAERGYREILARDPHNTDARAGLGTVLNWQGRHREAVAIFAALVADGVHTLDVFRGLAYAWYWAGRPDRARAPLDSVLARAPQDREGRYLDGRLVQELGTGPSGAYSSAHDSDGLDVRTWTANWRQAVGRKDGIYFLGRRDHVEDATVDTTLWRLGLGHERIWSTDWSTHAFGTLDVGNGDSRGRVFGDAWIVYRPSDVLRIDAGAGRDRVLTAGGLAFDVRVTTLALGFDWAATPSLRFTLAQRGSRYTDDNHSARTSAGLRLSLFAQHHVRVFATGSGEYLTTEKRLGHGYYDPRAHSQLAPGLDVSWEPHPWWSVGASGQAGWQKEAGFDWDPYGAISGRVDGLVTKNFAIGGDVSRSDSNLSSESGYRRTVWSVRASARF